MVHVGDYINVYWLASGGMLVAINVYWLASGACWWLYKCLLAGEWCMLVAINVYWLACW